MLIIHYIEICSHCFYPYILVVDKRPPSLLLPHPEFVLRISAYLQLLIATVTVKVVDIRASVEATTVCAVCEELIVPQGAEYDKRTTSFTVIFAYDILPFL